MSVQAEPRGSSWFRAVQCEGKGRNVELMVVPLEQEGHPPHYGWHELVGWQL
jgi:hypothetical protein